MPISLQLLRDDPERVRKSEASRFRSDKDLVSAVLERDAEWRPLVTKSDGLNRREKEVQAEIATLKKKMKARGDAVIKEVDDGAEGGSSAAAASGPALTSVVVSSGATPSSVPTTPAPDSSSMFFLMAGAIAERKALLQKAEQVRIEQERVKGDRDALVGRIGNIVHRDVPVAPGGAKSPASEDHDDGLVCSSVGCKHVRQRLRRMLADDMRILPAAGGAAATTAAGGTSEPGGAGEPSDCEQESARRRRRPCVYKSKSVTAEGKRFARTDFTPQPRLHSTALHLPDLPACDVFDTAEPSAWLPHWELLRKLGMLDAKERAAKIAGSRAYLLTGPGVLWNMALQNYATAFLVERGYEPVAPPLWMRPDMMGKTAELEDFDNQLYKVLDVGSGGASVTRTSTSISSGGSSAPPENAPGSDSAAADLRQQHLGSSTKYLIATSEQPLSAMYANERIDRSCLPIKLAGISQCFRRETASHGRDTKGVFRVNQFDKVEQFGISSAEASEALLQEFLGVSEQFYLSLGLDYRIVEIVSGQLNSAAARKFDLEAWFPSPASYQNTNSNDPAKLMKEPNDEVNTGKGSYRELVSCSNCTDYQSRALNVTTGSGKEKQYVHFVNATLCATQRTLCCLLENYQCRDGVLVPAALRPYLPCGEVDFFPFIE